MALSHDFGYEIQWKQVVQIEKDFTMLLRTVAILMTFHVADLTDPEPTGEDQRKIPDIPDLSDPVDVNREQQKGECMHFYSLIQYSSSGWFRFRGSLHD